MPAELEYKQEKVPNTLVPTQTLALAKRIKDFEQVMQLLNQRSLEEANQLKTRNDQRRQMIQALLQGRGEAMSQIPKLKFGIEDQQEG